MVELHFYCLNLSAYSRKESNQGCKHTAAPCFTAGIIPCCIQWALPPTTHLSELGHAATMHNACIVQHLGVKTGGEVEIQLSEEQSLTQQCSLFPLPVTDQVIQQKWQLQVQAKPYKCSMIGHSTLVNILLSILLEMALNICIQSDQELM